MSLMKSDNPLKDFYIPDYILVPGLDISGAENIPECPVIVFINTRSGGQLGGELLVTYQTLLNRNQVRFWFDYCVRFVFFKIELFLF